MRAGSTVRSGIRRPLVMLALVPALAVIAVAACAPAGGRTAAGTGAAVATPTGTGGRPASPAPGPPVRYVFPVGGAVSYARVHHDYPATDIMAPCGSPVRAVTAGTVLEVSRVDRYSRAVNDGATRGGLSVSILGDDGVRYYGSHLSAVTTGIDPGARVDAGQPLGLVGRTGDASACHLHFGISPPCLRTGDWWVRRGVVWPWPYLDSWRAGGAGSPVAQVRSWQAAHGCPASPPPGA